MVNYLPSSVHYLTINKPKFLLLNVPTHLGCRYLGKSKLISSLLETVTILHCNTKLRIVHFILLPYCVECPQSLISLTINLYLHDAPLLPIKTLLNGVRNQ
jgi:hypothetical protein